LGYKGELMNKIAERQYMIHWYREETGKTEVDLREVAKFAVDKGWKLPNPPDPLDLLASQLAQAARDETKKDKITGRPYRVNHALAIGQAPLWFDIDDPKVTRKKMVLSLANRREGMLADGIQLTFDADHWNSIHTDQEPIKPEMDFAPDIEWRKNSDGDIGKN
jgi:hypothetical protein